MIWLTRTSIMHIFRQKYHHASEELTDTQLISNFLTVSWASSKCTMSYLLSYFPNLNNQNNNERGCFGYFWLWHPVLYGAFCLAGLKYLSDLFLYFHKNLYKNNTRYNDLSNINMTKGPICFYNEQQKLIALPSVLLI